MFRQLESLSELEHDVLARLRDSLASQQHVCVAYSGGVDSSLVAAIAHAFADEQFVWVDVFAVRQVS